MPIELLTPASGARLLLLTGPQRLFIEQNASLMGNGGAAIDFLHPSLSGQADASQGVGLTLQWRGERDAAVFHCAARRKNESLKRWVQR